MSDQKLDMDALIQEIVKNSRDDRQRLVSCADGLRKFAERGGTQHEGDVEVMDPDIALALSEQLANISDSLTKINQQMIMLVQIDSKKKSSSDEPVRLTNSEKEEVYAELESKNFDA